MEALTKKISPFLLPGCKVLTTPITGKVRLPTYTFLKRTIKGDLGNQHGIANGCLLKVEQIPTLAEVGSWQDRWSSCRSRPTVANRLVYAIYQRRCQGLNSLQMYQAHVGPKSYRAKINHC